MNLSGGIPENVSLTGLRGVLFPHLTVSPFSSKTIERSLLQPEKDSARKRLFFELQEAFQQKALLATGIAAETPKVRRLLVEEEGGWE